MPEPATIIAGIAAAAAVAGAATSIATAVKDPDTPDVPDTGDAVAEARRRALQRAAQAKGRKATLLTGGSQKETLGDPLVSRPSILGAPGGPQPAGRAGPRL